MIPWKDSPVRFIKNYRPLVFAHRGNSSKYPENSFPAFMDAVKLGVDALETDVRITRDDVPVLFHDETLDRTTNGQGKVREFTFEELQDLELGHDFVDPVTGEYPFRGKGFKIIPLELLFERFPGMRVNIDIKDRFSSAPQVIHDLIVANNAEDRTLVGSFHHKQTVRFREISKRSIPTAATTREISLFLIGALKKRGINFEAIQAPMRHWFVKIITPRNITRAHDNNIAVHVWTINDVNTMKTLLNWNVDGIFTDFPETLINLMRDLGYRSSFQN